MPTGRRSFLKTIGAAGALAPQAAAQSGPAPARDPGWPRRFTGEALAEIAMPLGGVAAGSISLGGRGQLRDWEIYNKPDKGNQPAYAFASIWVKHGAQEPVARIAESRLLPPFSGATGLGVNNAPGLPRLESATFYGEYPRARIDFADASLPVRLSLEAFTPVFPLDADASGLPCALLRYRVSNPAPTPAEVAMAYSLDNPVGGGNDRKNELRTSDGLSGLVMTNAAMPADHALSGNFALAALGDAEVTIWRGWPRSRWWNAPMLFWDEFSKNGKLQNEPDPRNAVGAVCQRRVIPARGEAEFVFLLAWHFPNRTPERCGWRAPKGMEKTVIGNWYCQIFPSAWSACEHVAANLPELESRMETFLEDVAATTLPGPVREAAMANLSTLATQTVFRTSDGEFHGFEGSNDKSGCCFGSCTHVWNYETTTAHVFPALSRSMRTLAFRHTLDDNGGMRFRLMLPAGRELFQMAAADGQMGQVMKAFLDWRLSGDTEWLRSLWPQVRKAVEYAWKPGGWDADRDGVMEGVQHNTYDVEFYGPNPQCGVYYLGGLRAAEEMARALNEPAFAAECRKLFDSGSRWMDANLFNGEYYVQNIRGVKKDQILAGTLGDMGSENTENPEYQVGAGCLVDQLIGQYQSDVCGLGPLLNPDNITKTLASIWKYNHRKDLATHESVQRTYALNNEAGLLICDYGKAERPHIPFPYYAEVWTGFEYAVAAQMIWAGMTKEALAIVEGARARHDGHKRNPFDEPECGHHYARAMSAWSPFLALAGFVYDGPRRAVSIARRWRTREVFRSFWSCGTGWGLFTLEGQRLDLRVDFGQLAVREITIPARAAKPPARVELAGRRLPHTAERDKSAWRLTLDEPVAISAGTSLTMQP